MDHKQQKAKANKRLRKALGVRRRLRASGDHPRLSVYRSSKHISVQVIDDLQGRTVAAAGDMEASMADSLKGKTKSQRSAVVGTAIAERALAAGVEKVIFDRGRYSFTGRVQALADAAREGGLKF